MADRSRRTAADVLLELLGKVPDAAALEVLLEPEHLLSLLRARGHTDDAIRAQLRAGEKLPGELLLEVLAAEPDHRALLAELGDPAPRARASAGGSPLPSGPNTSLAGAQSTARSITQLVLGALLAVPSGWYLFVRLDVLHVPGLILHFPGAYALLITFLVVGVAAVIGGVLGLLGRRRA